MSEITYKVGDISHTIPGPPEPWVDAKTLGLHLGFKEQHIRNMARDGKLPGKPMQNGSRIYWRFRISEVDEWMKGGTFTHSLADNTVVCEVVSPMSDKQAGEQ